MRDVVRRLGALEIRLRAIDFFGRAPGGRIVLADLGLELGNLEHGQQLAGRHVVAHVHGNRLQKARDLGVYLDFLERSELGGNGDRLLHVAPADRDDGDGRRACGRTIDGAGIR